MQVTDQIFYVVVLITSVVVHEYAHGYIAYKLGDNTAMLSGRLTLNPIKHIDLFGSIIVPLMLVLSHTSFLIGWAKPVPYNPNNLRDKKRGTIFVALAGICANLLIAIIFGLLIRLAPHLGILYDNPFYKIASVIVLLNLVLALFNIIPIPPLDGSKILFGLLPYRMRHIEIFLQKWGIVFLLFFVFFIWDKVAPIIGILFSFLSGF